MAKLVEMKLEIVVTIDEDRLRDIFEEQEIKFTKKKANEVIDDFVQGFDQSEVEEMIEENFTDFLAENYGE